MNNNDLSDVKIYSSTVSGKIENGSYIRTGWMIDDIIPISVRSTKGDEVVCTMWKTWQGVYCVRVTDYRGNALAEGYDAEVIVYYFNL